MIAMLRGTVADTGTGRIVLDVHGVGYDVQVPGRTALTASGELTLWIHTSVREDAILLFGFATKAEKEIFEELISVNMVGPRIGLNALDALQPDALSRAVNGGDVRALSQIPGVGKKTAERIVLELKGKLTTPVTAGVVPTAVAKADDGFALALAQLGFKKSEIDAAAARLVEDGLGNAPLPERIAAALRRMGASR